MSSNLLSKIDFVVASHIKPAIKRAQLRKNCADFFEKAHRVLRLPRRDKIFNRLSALNLRASPIFGTWGQQEIIKLFEAESLQPVKLAKKLAHMQETRSARVKEIIHAGITRAQQKEQDARGSILIRRRFVLKGSARAYICM